MAKFSNQKYHGTQRTFSAESVHLGTFIHPAGDLLVLKLEHKDIPYPNAPVLFNKKQVGKVDEVFGPIDDVYVSVKLDPNQKAADFTVSSKFEAYKDKFIFKDRFLPREEAERNKERNDKKKAANSKGPKPASKDKNKFSLKKKPSFSKQMGKFSSNRSPNGNNRPGGRGSN